MTVDYTIRSPSAITVVSSTFDDSEEIDPQTEPVELVTITSSTRNLSRRVHHEKSEPIILTPKPLALPALTYQPHSVVKKTPVYELVRRTPTKALMVRETKPPEKTFLQKKPPFKWYISSFLSVSSLLPLLFSPLL